jgi:hypothetical protein
MAKNSVIIKSGGVFFLAKFYDLSIQNQTPSWGSKVKNVLLLFAVVTHQQISR